MTTEAEATLAAACHSDLRPDMAPFEEQLGIRGFTFQGTLAGEISAGSSPAPKRWTCSTTCSRSVRWRR